jgi:hypothetical protein
MPRVEKTDEILFANTSMQRTTSATDVDHGDRRINDSGEDLVVLIGSPYLILEQHLFRVAVLEGDIDFLNRAHHILL